MKNKRLLMFGIFFVVISILAALITLFVCNRLYISWNTYYRFIPVFAIFFVIGLVLLILSFIINKEGNNIVNEQKNSENYVESRFGSIELFDDYFVVSANFVPFKSARRKRAVCIIYYDQLVNAMFRPAGWFRGHIWLWSKSCMRQRADTVIPFRLWLPWTSRANSKEYEAIYNRIVEKIHENKKQLRDNATKNVIY